MAQVQVSFRRNGAFDAEIWLQVARKTKRLPQKGSPFQLCEKAEKAISFYAMPPSLRNACPTRQAKTLEPDVDFLAREAASRLFDGIDRPHKFRSNGCGC